jgi:hypothetical protein
LTQLDPDCELLGLGCGWAGGHERTCREAVIINFATIPFTFAIFITAS